MTQWKALDEAQRQQREKTGMATWHEWMAKNKAAIVEGGAPLGKTKRISKDGIADTSRRSKPCRFLGARFARQTHPSP